MPEDDPSSSAQEREAFLARLTPAEREEALAAAAAARRAEERAEQRALERALRQKEEQRRRERQAEQKAQVSGKARSLVALRGNHLDDTNSSNERVVFVPKRKREQLQKEQQQQQQQKSNGETSKRANAAVVSSNGTTNAAAAAAATGSAPARNNEHEQQQAPTLSEKERMIVRETYLGKSAIEQEDEQAAKRKMQKSNKKITFKFRWDNTDDTFHDDDPLYASMLPASRTAASKQKKTDKLQKMMGSSEVSSLQTVLSKPLEKMTSRDWKILRESFEITVKGGKAPPPMRSFRESPAPAYLPQLHPALLEAIEHVLNFKEPSPIQRQTIPIGLQRRDLIGIAETGSGKTVAFGVPLCHYLLNLPDSVLGSVAEQGPLALIMAPTRELALQIEVELQKLLSCQQIIKACAIVGGQPIQKQAQEIRKGVHIIVGTPGRINDCIEQAYLVLNQCCYIVMDEADRMVDMGFLPQMESILDAMGGALKSEDENETYRQEMEDLKTSGVARHRLTAMFSATMPLEVERIAKRYLRHPSIISIGDKDTVKNARIHQRLVWLPSPAKKEDALRDLLRDRRFIREKVIVFVNEKKHADGVGRMVERSGRQCVVLHGGKSQEQREENLEAFRKGGIVMVATDVAGRGLDIPDVAHVINYDLPTRSIENYTHRIGRTGRAGKEGFATSFITDEDEGIMAALRSYLESTGNEVPAKLARHPAAGSVSASNSVMY